MVSQMMPLIDEQRNAHGFPPIQADKGSSVSSHVDQSTNINRALPWMVLLAGISAAAFVVSCFEHKVNEDTRAINAAEMKAVIASFEAYKAVSQSDSQRLLDQFKRTETEYRMTQYYVENQDATLIAMGLKRKDDTLSIYLKQHLKQEHQ